MPSLSYSPKKKMLAFCPFHTAQRKRSSCSCSSITTNNDTFFLLHAATEDGGSKDSGTPVCWPNCSCLGMRGLGYPGSNLLYVVFCCVFLDPTRRTKKKNTKKNKMKKHDKHKTHTKGKEKNNKRNHWLLNAPLRAGPGQKPPQDPSKVKQYTPTMQTLTRTPPHLTLLTVTLIYVSSTLT